METNSKSTFKDKAVEFLFVNVGLLMIAVGVWFFKTPNGFSTGGVSGFSIVVSRLCTKANPDTFFTMATVNLIVNLLALLCGFFFLGKSFGIKTALCSVIYSLEIFAFEHLLPIEAFGGSTLTDQPFLELVFAILLTGIGSSILFRYGASSGGTDVVAMILKKHTRLDIGRALLCTDFLIATSSFFVFGITAGLFSLLGLFAKAFLVDSVIENMNQCKCFIVITENPELIEPYITQTLHHSATELQAVGVYSHRDKKMIITVCRRIEAFRLKKKIKEVDPHSFIIITNSNEILGRGFRSV